MESSAYETLLPADAQGSYWNGQMFKLSLAGCSVMTLGVTPWVVQSLKEDGGVADVSPIVPQLTRRKIKPAGDFAWNILQSMSLNSC